MEREQQNHPKIETNWCNGAVSGGWSGGVSGGWSCGVNGGGAVMTDEQLETLRKQIAIYTAICKQLFEMHKTLTASADQPQQDLAAVTLGISTSALSGPCREASSRRPRWNPIPTQLDILERIFSKATTGSFPSKQKIREIAAELSHHGLVSETNVYNWFQNRRARSKRKTAPRKSAKKNGDSGGEITQVMKSRPPTVENNNIADPDKTLVSSRLDSSAPIRCTTEDPEIRAELLHFFDPRPPEMENIFSSNAK